LVSRSTVRMEQPSARAETISTCLCRGSTFTDPFFQERDRATGGLWNPKRQAAIFGVQVIAQGRDPWVAI
jgi:hypothetical protein